MVTLEDFRKELRADQFETLSDGDETVAERCLGKARTWLIGKTRPLAITLDETDAVTAEIILKRATYELYAFAEVEAMAKDKKQAATELARSQFGPGFDGEGYENGGVKQPLTSAVIISGPVQKKVL